MESVIITADDYGMSPAVNKAIEACAKSGAVTSTNVMVNLGYYESAAELKNKYRGISIGIHFCLTTGKALLPHREIPTLTEDDGSFFTLSELNARLKRGSVDKKDAVKELTAQYDRFREVVGQPDYWCSHEHVHVAPGLFYTISELSQHFCISAMRNNRKIFVGGKPAALSRAKSAVLGLMAGVEKRKGVWMPDGLLTFVNKEDKLNLDAYKGINQGGYRFAELMIHPATEIDSLYFGKLSEMRFSEYKFFSDPLLPQKLQSFGVKLSNFEGEGS
ncbi:MAG: ChbG/HpnK family deacetylase [Bacillota bacterium]|nr:ChbG/HpnK family deacetylase [Bacillota bacterium]